MDNVERIADDVYMVKQPLHDVWYVGVLVFVGREGIGLVDTGFEKTPAEYVFPLIREIGRSVGDVVYVVNTHRDRDHVEGNLAVKEATKARIGAHELEAEAIKDVDVKLRDGDTVRLGDRRLKVIHTPGHRPGVICLYDEGSRLLISGDAICGERTDLIRMDKKVYIASLRKLLGLKVSLLVMGHPFKPLGKAVLTGEEAKVMMEASIAIAEKP
jgi:glyoxylase-like metal-dependent hydrolase (beta-lactamase superfamily II)